jgi:hypothetical protein
MHTIFPRYLARPSDGTVFSLNKDGKTYSMKESKDERPFNLHHEYKLSHLISLDFYEVQESEFPALKKIGEEYLEFTSWTSRSDGHGGCKGGTFEEFKLMKKTFKLRRVLQEVQQLANAGCYYGKTEEDFTKRLIEIKELISKNL